MTQEQLDRRFEEMTDPPLADRLRAFEQWLMGEPCVHPGNLETWGVLERKPDEGGCIILSNSHRMCCACRLRLHFHHCIHYAENYEGGPGEIPRLPL